MRGIQLNRAFVSPSKTIFAGDDEVVAPIPHWRTTRWLHSGPIWYSFTIIIGTSSAAGVTRVCGERYAGTETSPIGPNWTAWWRARISDFH